MPRPKLSDQELGRILADVFRTHGYEGATLSLIAQATGLEKASLYHRYPGGKDDMVDAAVVYLNDWFATNVFAVLDQPGTPSERLRTVAVRLREFYDGGRKSCALNSLSLPSGSDALHQALQGAVNAWLQAFASVARQSGATSAKARERATQAIIEIQGALVLSRVLDDCKPFQKVLNRLPDLLLDAGSK